MGLLFSNVENGRGYSRFQLWYKNVQTSIVSKISIFDKWEGGLKSVKSEMRSHFNAFHFQNEHNISLRGKSKCSYVETTFKNAGEEPIFFVDSYNQVISVGLLSSL